MLKRYRHWLGEEARHMVETFDGDYVLYTDHLAAIEEKDKEIERLKKSARMEHERFVSALGDLQSKDFEISELHSNLAEKDKVIEEKNNEIDNLKVGRH